MFSGYIAPASSKMKRAAPVHRAARLKSNSDVSYPHTPVVVLQAVPDGQVMPALVHLGVQMP